MNKLTEDVVKSYLKRVDNARLTVDEERALSSTIHSETASEEEKGKAINELASKNLKLVIKEAFKYAMKTHVDVEDLIAAAVNSASGKVEQEKKELLGNAMGGINLPDGFKFPF